jgi:hypothetical protein
MTRGQEALSRRKRFFLLKAKTHLVGDAEQIIPPGVVCHGVRVGYLVSRLELPRFPVSDGTISKCIRNAEIHARHKKGETIATLAEAFGITQQRIWQILNDRRK